MFAPGSALAATIAAFSFAVQERRRRRPVILDPAIVTAFMHVLMHVIIVVTALNHLVDLLVGVEEIFPDHVTGRKAAKADASTKEAA